MNDGAICPATNSLGATSNSDHRVTDATKKRATAPPQTEILGALTNDPG